ncbi:MAG: hypothetical protein ABJC89_10920 [Acidobacteriota bacterium]
MKKVVWSSGLRLGAAVAIIAASVSCGSLTRQGQAPSYLIIESLGGAPGASTTFGGNLSSDVVTKNSVFSDNGQVQFLLAQKDATSPTDPTSANFITVERYHVEYIRTDGHNIQGVDVPYAFDGAVTVTVASTATAVFTLVRVQAKEEAPLRALGGANQIVIATIAEVTFYGHDQTGHAVSVSGKISVSFANFADPA